MIKRLFFLFLLSFSILPRYSNGQGKIIDQIVATVGNHIIMESDIENQYIQMRSQGYTSQGDLKCEVMEDLLSQKLMLHQAMVDSIEVTEPEVESELNRRLQDFSQRIGSEAKLEAYYNKSMLEIKEDFRELVRNQLLIQSMQQTIINEITVTPSEIKSFFRTIPKDSLPLIPEQVEYRQIMRNPPYSEKTKLAVRERLLELRKRILNGEDFATLAILYSEDPGSARNGGEMDYMGKSELVKEFADAAFALKKGAISSIVETKFGFHIIQLIDRKGEKVKVRHILLKPKVTSQESEKALSFLDSIAQSIRADSITFIQAVRMYSQDEDTRMSGGLVVNPNSGDSHFSLDQLDQNTAEAIRNLKTGEVSRPFEATDMAGNKNYKIIEIMKRIPAHKADLKHDYALLQQLTKQSKQQEAFKKWIVEKQKTTYIRIDDSYKGCPFSNKGWVK